MNNNQQCTQCSDTSCARCSASNLSLCTSCFDGRYLSSGSCTACPNGCSTCNSANNCLSCSSGYTLQIQAIVTQSSCIQCQSPCAQCIGNAVTCTQCISGFSLNGWKCVSNFNFGFQLTLDTTLNNFYSNYNSFLTSLAQIIGGNTNQITIINIIQGSVNVDGSINTDSTSNSNSANQ